MGHCIKFAWCMVTHINVHYLKRDTFFAFISQEQQYLSKKVLAPRGTAGLRSAVGRAPGS